MPKVGRNDPCPCGSGKKYKKCCLASDEEAQRPAKDHHQQCIELVNSLTGRLMHFAKKKGFSENITEAASIYRALSDMERDPYQDEGNYNSFMGWFLHDYQQAGTVQTIIELYLESHPPLPAEGRQLLEEWKECVISAYQVIEVERGKGAKVKGLLEEVEYFLCDSKLSEQLMPGEIIVARVYKVMDEHQITAEAALGEGRLKKPFLKKVEHALEEFHQHHPEASTKEFLKSRGFTLPTLLIEAYHENFALPKMVTTSGEELVWMEARYDLSDRGQAIQRLKGCQDFELEDSEADAVQAEEVKFVWLDTAESVALVKKLEKDKLGATTPQQQVKQFGEGGRLLGHLILKRNHLVLSAMGEGRFNVGKKRLEGILAGLIKHRLDSVEPLETTIKKAGLESKPRPNNAPTPPFTGHQFEPLQPGESIGQALRNRQFKNIDEVNQFLAQAQQDYNNLPQKEMGGLSPLQVGRLLDSDWEDDLGPIRLNRSLTPGDLAGVHILHNARLLLTHCLQEDGIKATSSGYLNTDFVRRMVAEMQWPKRLAQFVQDANHGRLREMGVPQIYSLRLTAEVAGLIKDKKGRFVVTTLGRELLAPEKAGELYSQFFVTFFTELNLDILDRDGMYYPNIQDTIAFSLYGLSRLAPGVWRKLEDIVPSLLLPIVKQSIAGDEDYSTWDEHQRYGATVTLLYRLAEPMESFGLLDMKDTEDDLSPLIATPVIRPTPLLAKFISFDLD